MKMHEMVLGFGFAIALAGCDQKVATDPVASTPATTPAGATVNAPAPAGAIDSCNIERVDEQLFKTTYPEVRAGIVRISGWMIDKRTNSIPTNARLQLLTEGSTAVHEQPILMWRNRPDVVAAHSGEAAYSQSGFSVDFDLKGVAPGKYRVVLSGVSGVEPVTCNNDRHILVTQ